MDIWLADNVDDKVDDNGWLVIAAQLQLQNGHPGPNIFKYSIFVFRLFYLFFDVTAVVRC